MEILCNISRNWDGMEFDRLIKYSLRNIKKKFQISYTKRGRITIPRTFTKKLKLTISLDQ